jgi:uncharacterized membrane protein YhiD involved in acid resistance
MGRNQTFQDFLVSQSVEISTWGFVINLLLAAILAITMGAIYIKYGTSLSNRKAFARNFVMVTMTTMFIITVVKSSLALSLGLVGALSIVRFRTAVKEPEELAYMFLAIAIGLGLGADQRIITLLAFPIIIGIIMLRKYVQKSNSHQNLFLTISSHNPKRAELPDIVQVLKTHCTEVSLKRFDDTQELLEAAFQVEFEDFPQLEASKTDLQKLGDAVKVTFLDNKSIGGIN